MATQPSRSETDLLDINMEVDPLSDSVTQINLLNKTIQPESQRDSPVDDGPAQAMTFIETKGKRLKAALTIIAKASHHKNFMETCLIRNSSPKNISLWVQPRIYTTWIQKSKGNGETHFIRHHSISPQHSSSTTRK